MRHHLCRSDWQIWEWIIIACVTVSRRIICITVQYLERLFGRCIKSLNNEWSWLYFPQTRRLSPIHTAYSVDTSPLTDGSRCALLSLGGPVKWKWCLMVSGAKLEKVTVLLRGSLLGCPTVPCKKSSYPEVNMLEKPHPNAGKCLRRPSCSRSQLFGTLMFPSLSPSLPLFLKINKIFKNKKYIPGSKDIHISIYFICTSIYIHIGIYVGIFLT